MRLTIGYTAKSESTKMTVKAMHPTLAKPRLVKMVPPLSFLRSRLGSGLCSQSSVADPGVPGVISQKSGSADKAIRPEVLETRVEVEVVEYGVDLPETREKWLRGPEGGGANHC